MIRRIHYYDEPILRQKTPEVKVFDVLLREYANDLKETFYSHDAFGLAAPQVGLPIRMFMIDVYLDGKYGDIPVFTYDGKKVHPKLVFPMVCVNPIIDAYLGPDYITEERCLSLPNIDVPIVRQEHIKAHFQDIDGNVHHLECAGIFARCFQHENDHLNGVLVIDYIQKKNAWRYETKLKQLKRDTQKYIKSLKSNPKT